MWVGTNVYENGVATEILPIKRYKRTESGDDFVYIGDLKTDFGHFNSVDYNEANDCLIFTNSANEVTTEGNYFTVIKNPLALSGEVKKSEVGIRYNVDIGYKVNCVWGHCNLGENNIVYALSNNAAKLTTFLLKKDSNGNFNGEYVMLKSQDTGLDIGIGGLSYWKNDIYIGNGTSYSVTILNVTTLKSTEETFESYRNDATKVSGSTQGVFVDSQYIWRFLNVGSKYENYLLQSYH